VSADVFEVLARTGARRCILWSDPPSGLRAVLVIDSLVLGPAAGGVRTRAYPSLEAAVEDAAQLARAMTVKCALGGLAAGGAKAVVLDHPELDRARAFAVLGQRVQELGGLFRTAGDLGTTAADLHAMASTCAYVHTDESGLADAVARGLLGCIAACAAERLVPVAGLRVAVQGAGAIGAAVARALVAAGACVVLADLDRVRATKIAAEIGAEVVAAGEILASDVDIVSPCAVGGVLDAATVGSLRAWAVCGAANNILADSTVAALLQARGILLVPDVVASAGAVVDGIGASVMDLTNRAPLVDALGHTAARLLAESARTGRTTVELADEWARDRLRSR
jgi:leucine dehydrogenase